MQVGGWQGSTGAVLVTGRQAGSSRGGGGERER
jgi:hypothetical protein